MNHKCQFPNGINISLDGKHSVDPCLYELMETHKNVTVKVYRCPNCGSVDISWERQEDTEDIIHEKF